MDFAKAGLIVGASGDAGLQIGASQGILDAGLKTYFETQGPIQSILKAALLTGFWSGVFGFLYPSGSLLSFVAYACVLDLLYRRFHPEIYPSLHSYYEFNSTSRTLFYNGIVALLVWETKEFFF